MGYGASLMAAWTALLLWAYRRPLERSFVAALTVFVIYGLVTTEVVAVLAGHMAASRMVPTWCLQAGLVALFTGGYHYPWFRQRGEALCSHLLGSGAAMPANGSEGSNQRRMKR